MKVKVLNIDNANKVLFDSIAKYEKVIDKFKTEIDRYSVTDISEWLLPETVRAEKIIKWLQPLIHFLDYSDEVTEERYRNVLLQLKKDCYGFYQRNGFRHNSTSQISNFVSMEEGKSIGYVIDIIDAMLDRLGYFD